MNLHEQEAVKTLVKQIINDDLAKAQDTFKSIISTKAVQQIEDRKVHVGRMMSGIGRVGYDLQEESSNSIESQLNDFKDKIESGIIKRLKDKKDYNEKTAKTNIKKFMGNLVKTIKGHKLADKYAKLELTNNRTINLSSNKGSVKFVINVYDDDYIKIQQIEK
jgi:hypothetical protein